MQHCSCDNLPAFSSAGTDTFFNFYFWAVSCQWHLGFRRSGIQFQGFRHSSAPQRCFGWFSHCPSNTVKHHLCFYLSVRDTYQIYVPKWDISFLIIWLPSSKKLVFVPKRTVEIDCYTVSQNLLRNLSENVIWIFNKKLKMSGALSANDPSSFSNPGRL